jgi:hypothetical protein
MQLRSGAARAATSRHGNAHHDDTKARDHRKRVASEKATLFGASRATIAVAVGRARLCLGSRKAKHRTVVELAELGRLSLRKGHGDSRNRSGSTADSEYPYHQSSDGLAHHGTFLLTRGMEPLSSCGLSLRTGECNRLGTSPERLKQRDDG